MSYGAEYDPLITLRGFQAAGEMRSRRQADRYQALQMKEMERQLAEQERMRQAGKAAIVPQQYRTQAPAIGYDGQASLDVAPEGGALPEGDLYDAATGKPMKGVRRESGYAPAPQISGYATDMEIPGNASSVQGPPAFSRQAYYDALAHGGDPMIAEQEKARFGAQDMEAQKAALAMQKDLMGLGADRLKVLAQQSGAMADAAAGILSMPPEQRAQATHSALSEMASSGMVTPEQAQKAWQRYQQEGDQFLQQIYTSGVGAKTMYEKSMQQPTEAGLAMKAATGDATADKALTRLTQNRKDSKVVVMNGGGLSSKAQTQVQKLASQFDSNPVVKNFNEQVNKYEGVKAIIDAGVGGPGDLAMVYEFMRALDPTSVVRESEYQSAAASGNIFSGWAAKFNGYFKAEGGFLPQQVKQSFIEILKRKVAISGRQVKAMYDDYGRRVEKVTGEKSGSGKDYLTDYSTIFGAEGGGGAITVKAPDGSSHTFDTQEQADAFKKLAGIK